jgi:ankyrin repeat protein
VPVQHKQSEIMKLLLEYGADPNVPCRDYQNPVTNKRVTPLRYAERENLTDIVSMLKEAGAENNLW